MSQVKWPNLLAQADVARLLNVSPQTVRTWRWAKKGPPFRKLHGRVLYEEQDVLHWVAAQPKYNTAVPVDAARS